MTLWRVLVMKHKVDSFINGCKRDVRIYAKEYDDVEINNLEKSQKDIDRVNREVADSKNAYITSCDSTYQEVYQVLLHLKFLRLYVESILKYGVSENLQCIIFTSPGKEASCVSKLIKAFSDTSNIL